MSHLPSKHDQIRCVTSRDMNAFSHGCYYDVEKVIKAKRIVYVYGDDGNMHEIDWPHDMTKGIFEAKD